jgi:hypothetical protein
VQGGSSKRIYFFNYGALPWTEYEESRWEKAKNTFRDGIEVARGSGAEIILVYVPIKFRVYRELITIPPGSPLRHWGVWSLPQKFVEFCRSVSVPCVDLTDRLQQAVREGVDVYALNDTHWTSDGHALIADELARVLRSLDSVSQPGSGRARGNAIQNADRDASSAPSRLRAKPRLDEPGK